MLGFHDQIVPDIEDGLKQKQTKCGGPSLTSSFTMLSTGVSNCWTEIET